MRHRYTRLRHDCGVTRLIAIEGIDGSGKATLTAALTTQLRAGGRTVATLAFPRYGTTMADIAAEALRGGHGDLAASARAMALLFATDRRDANAAGLAPTATAGANTYAGGAVDIVLLDRYVASNAAFTAAREGGADPAAWEDAFAWVADLEFGRFALPRPDLQVLLAVPTAVALERAASREAGDATRTRDRYERDADLQANTAAAYEALAERKWNGPWLRSDGTEGVAELTAEIVSVLG